MNDDFGKTVSIVLLIAAAALGMYSLKDRQPRGEASLKSAEIAPPNEQDVTARLWEDPLQAVNSDIATKKAAGDSTDRSIATLGGANKANRVLVVSIPETPFPDDVEVRLRMRYAVQLALTSENYLPDNGNALGYVTWHLTAKRTLPVPYERFSHRATADSVLLLWLPEAILNDSTNSALNALANLRGLFPDTTSLAFIGPRASGTLKSFIKSDKPPGDLSRLRTGFKIFSSAATAPDYFLDPEFALAGPRQAVAERIKNVIFENPGTNAPPTVAASAFFESVIGTDEQLTDLIVRELDLRQIALAKKENKADDILVLAEADTSYGHSLPLVLQASIYSALKTSRAKDGPPSPTCLEFANAQKDVELNGSPVKIFRYLRGLDQQKGSSQAPKTDERTIARSPEEALTQALNKKSRPSPVGESQLDYAERLAQNAGVEFGRNLKAIGILGSDVYDKMILLRTLRPKFPNAVFFTTDLDARMWHPDVLSFTRNLIVASSGDLNGSRTNIPPFRDNYQAAVFDACLRALNSTNSSTSRPPVLFELGRDGPVPLVSTSEKSSVARPALTTLNVTLAFMVALVAAFVVSLGKWERDFRVVFASANKWIFAEAQTWRIAAWSLVVAAAVSAMVMFIMADKASGCLNLASSCLLLGAFGYAKSTHGSVEEWARKQGVRIAQDFRVIAAVLLAAALALVFRQIAIISSFDSEEQFSWSSGTSAWPTEVVRLCVVAIALVALVGAWTRHRIGRVTLKRKFALNRNAPRASASASEKHPLWSRWPAVTGSQSAPAAAIYKLYLSKARFRWRAARASLATVIYMSLCFALVFIVDGGMPEQTHIRGPRSILFDRIVLIGSVTTFIFLIFYVMDAVSLTARMLLCITGCQTGWDAKLKQKTASQHFVTPDDVSGYLDVQFAATKSEELRLLIILPLLMQFLFILARNPYFDNWSWPPMLIVIFTSNMLLAVFTWIKLRSIAKRIRGEALNELDDKISAAQQAVDVNRNGPDRPRLRALLRLRQKIEGEKKGAYSNFIQDPTVVAMLFPSSAVTIALILLQALFQR